MIDNQPIPRFQGLDQVASFGTERLSGLTAFIVAVNGSAFVNEETANLATASVGEWLSANMDGSYVEEYRKKDIGQGVSEHVDGYHPFWQINTGWIDPDSGPEILLGHQPNGTKLGANFLLRTYDLEEQLPEGVLRFACGRDNGGDRRQPTNYLTSMYMQFSGVDRMSIFDALRFAARTQPTPGNTHTGFVAEGETIVFRNGAGCFPKLVTHETNNAYQKPDGAAVEIDTFSRFISLGRVEISVRP
ncbi:MAG: hypothetical protein Q7T41_03765 [Candidatus Saccharibacteria bacterium]|nr:hypothetical protein [Candidatus Saccharibacteria bacterium]